MRLDAAKALRRQLRLLWRGKARRLDKDLIPGSWERTQTLLSHDDYLQVHGSLIAGGA